MRDYMKGLRCYDVTVTAGLEHTATTFTEAVLARNRDEARKAMENKWQGAAVGAVVDVAALSREAERCAHAEKSRSANGGACVRRCTRKSGHEAGHILSAWSLE